jgi:predicted RNase H-like HicB family nuclease
MVTSPSYPAALESVKSHKNYMRCFGAMVKQRYVYWKDEDMWLGYLEEFPDYWTQAETEEELKENLIDVYKELTSGSIPNVRRVADLEIS